MKTKKWIKSKIVWLAMFIAGVPAALDYINSNLNADVFLSRQNLLNFLLGVVLIIVRVKFTDTVLSYGKK